MILPKVLILTTNYGEGHLQVAKTLKNEFSSIGVDCISRDLYYETSPIINELTRKVYLKSYTTSGRHFYRLFYYGSKHISKNKNLTILSYGYTKLKNIIAEFQPDLIINTFPFLSVPFYRKKTNTLIPTYNVVTDYCIHNLWIHPNIDKYYVATTHLQSELEQMGIEEARIAVTGIPISADFEKMMNKPKLSLLSPAKRTILIIAGAYGVSREVKQICELLQDDTLLKLIIVCGKNNELYQHLRFKYHDYKNITVYGYVNNMHELLRMATCVITKPGGVILSEAIATNTPIILPKATPGQERENALFFKSAGAAIWNEKIEQLVIETKQLARDVQKQNKMKQSLENLHIPSSSKSIITDILEDYHSRINFTQVKLRK